jgi:molybdopterin/thiamine biosynthesis adenylyltransferase
MSEVTMPNPDEKDIVDETAAVVERLRDESRCECYAEGAEWHYCVRCKAADLLERLRSELARTERNRDMWKGQCERQAARLTIVNALPEPCVESLSPRNQQQIDEDGVLVAVSRQAADEIYAVLQSVRAGVAASPVPQNGEGG